MCSNLCCKNILKRICIFELSARNYSLTIPCSSKQREARFMGKLLGFSKPKKKFQIYNNSKIMNPIEEISHKAPKMANKRRQVVLNNLFMKNITDIMVTSDLGIDVVELGIEITRVAISVDYSFLNAYYRIQNETPDLETMLQHLSMSLRHELSQLKLMGNVPRIKFIKDKYSSNAVVDYLLSKADFGDEDSMLAEEMEDEFELLPPMENKVYGLDHSKIMERIKFYQKRASAHHRKMPQVIDKENDDPSSLPLDKENDDSTSLPLDKENDETTSSPRKEMSNSHLDSHSIIYKYILSKKKKR